MLRFDADLFHLFNASADTPPWVVGGARFASTWVPGLCVLAVIAGMLALGKGWRRGLQMALLSMACAWLACRLIRWGVPMPRPAQLGLGIQWIKHGAGAGFPSMHAAGAFALAQSMQLGAPRRLPWLLPLIWLLACAVALSRVVLGVHFPSDIVIGALIGCACAVGVRYADMRLTRRHNARQGIAPAPAE